MKISFGVLLSAATLVSTSLAGPVRLVERQREPFNLTVDDGNSYLKYEEDGWIHLTNQGSQWKDGTESYTDNPNGAYKFYWPVVSKDMGQTFNITIFSGRKNDRGNFKVGLSNGTELGTGNAYADSDETTSSEVTFEALNFYIAGPTELVVRNSPSEGKPFMALDYIRFDVNGQYTDG